MISYNEALEKAKVDKVAFATEDDTNYYIRPIPEDHYDHLMWKVDKNTGIVEFLDLIDYLTAETEDGKDLTSMVHTVIDNREE